MLISVAKKLVRRFGFKIRHHPMAGLVYRGDSFCSAAAPKLLSTYEIEISEVLVDVIAQRPRTLAVIGSADGFFAVGLARALPSSRIIAYEIDDSAREMSRELATRNGVASRMEFRGGCDPAGFRSLLTEDTPDFILMDIEGAELDLMMSLDSAVASRARLLIELHDFGDGTIVGPIIGKFSGTHEVTIYPAVERRLSDIPFPLLRPLVGLLRLIGRDYLYERPPGMSWLGLVPKQTKDAAVTPSK